MRQESSSKNLISQAGPVQSVLIGTSLTPSSDDVVVWALAVARALEAKIRLLHAIPLEPIGFGFDGTFGLDVLATLKEQQKSRLAAQTRRLGIAESELVDSEIVFDAPHVALAESARSNDVDLILVGPSNDTGPGRHLLGSTADRLLRCARCPVLILRENLPLPPSRVLAPTDFSSTSALAMETAVHLLTQMSSTRGSTIETLFVLSPLSRELPAQFSPQQIDRMAKEELLQFTFAHTVGWGGSIETKVRIGDARDQLLHESQNQTVDLIVVGSHGHGRLHRALIGSVAGQLAQRASCSVLFVPFATEEEASSHVVSRRGSLLPEHRSRPVPRPPHQAQPGPGLERANGGGLSKGA